MLGTQFHSCRKAQDIVLRKVRDKAFHVRDGGSSECQCASLVKGHMLHCGKALQRVPLAHKEAVPCGIANGSHDGCGRSKDKGAGAEDHKDGHGAQDFACDKPAEDCGHEGNDHDPGCPAIGKAHNLGLACGRGLDQTYHALQGAVLAYLEGAHVKGAELIDSSGEDSVSGVLVHWQGFASHDSLVDGCGTGHDNAVYRYRFAWQDTDEIVYPCLFGCHNVFCPIRMHDACGPGCEMHKTLDACPGLGNGQLFQKGAQLHDEGHFTCSKVLAHYDGRDKCHGNKYVRLDIEGSNKAVYGCQDNWYTAEDDGYPGSVKGEGKKIEAADNQGKPRNDQKDDVPFGPAKLEKFFKRIHCGLLYLWGYRYIEGSGMSQGNLPCSKNPANWTGKGRFLQENERGYCEVVT